MDGQTKYNKLSAKEQETHLYITSEEQWEAYTTIPKDIRKFEKQGWMLKTEELYPDKSVYSRTYVAPRNAITIRTPHKRVISEEQRKAASERFKKMHERKSR